MEVRMRCLLDCGDIRRLATRALASLLLVGMLACAATVEVAAQIPIAQLYHKAWTTQEGAPNNIIHIAVGMGGFLWLATDDGLYRFDGVSFTRYMPPPGSSLLSDHLLSMIATRDDSLWVTYTLGGVSRIRNGRITNFTERDGLRNGQTNWPTEDEDGGVWVGGSAGLQVIRGTKVIQVGAENGLPVGPIQCMVVDSPGNLWVALPNELLVKPRRSNHFQTVRHLSGNGLRRLSKSPDGGVILSSSTEPILCFWYTNGEIRQKTGLNTPGAERVLPLRDGSVWVLTEDRGLERFPGGLDSILRSGGSRPETYTSGDGLSSNHLVSIVEDDEGSVWAASEKGIDQFRPTAFRPVDLGTLIASWLTLPVGAPGTQTVIGTNRLIGLENGRALPLTAPFPGGNYGILRSLFRGKDGVLWVGTAIQLWRYAGGKLLAQEMPTTLNNLSHSVQAIAEDDSRGIWISVIRNGLFRFDGKHWVGRGGYSNLSNEAPLCAMQDHSGGVWFGFRADRIAHIAGGHLQMLGPSDKPHLGDVKVFAEGDGQFWVGGDEGASILRDGHFYPLALDANAPLQGVTGLAFSPDGALWINQSGGVLRLDKAEVDSSIRTPGYAAKYQSFNFLDGLDGSPTPLAGLGSALLAADGKLYIATHGNLQWIDPMHLPHNDIPPQVWITGWKADDQAGFWPSSAPLTFRPRIETLQIDYTATSLLIPERVRFRYRLDGYDKAWTDAGTRREAFYSRLPPGKYTFRVIACNNSGIWNEAGASLIFSIAPAWYQTVWFRTLCSAAFLGLLGMLYQFRIWRLRQSEKKLRKVIETIPTFVWTALPNGSVDFLNRHYEDYAGISVEKSVGSTWKAVVHPEDLDRHLERFRSAQTTGDAFENESRFRCVDGQYHWFLTRAVPLRDSRGKIVRWYGTSIEIEDRKRAEQLQADLAHIRRANTMSQLTASLSHEIKQPIGAAVTNAETCLRLLSRNEPDLPDAREAALEMTKDARRAADIIDRVRALYHKGHPQLEIVDVNEVVREMLNMLQNEANRHSVSMHTDLAEGLPTVTADRVQLQQVLMNLMLNGMEAMKDTGGELNIKSQLREGGELLISVTDNGMGLPAGRTDEIFNAFFTTKSHGTGLGLAITRTILEAHGGRVWATANAGRGTTFYFTLPLRASVSA